MKLLMFLAKRFTFRPFEKTLPDADHGGGEVQVDNAAVVFVNAEPAHLRNSPKCSYKAQPRACATLATR